MKKEPIICPQCHKPAPFGVLFQDGLCYACHRDSFPTCQYPGCKNKCDRMDHILCDMHFQFLIHDGMSPELTSKFCKQLEDMGVHVVIFEN